MDDQSIQGPPRLARDRGRRWLTLCVLCLGVLMTELDTTIVNVALPSIRKDLKVHESSLVWIVNGYMLAFGGFLLAGGRMGDLYGHRRMFLVGTALFTISSLLCGMANSQEMLIAARAAQGLGGAVVLAVALALITNLFTDWAERAQAIGLYSFVCAGGGSIGLLLGGIVTSAFSWHWIFLVNGPFGLFIFVRCLSLLGKGVQEVSDRSFDIGGLVTVTGSLLLASYAIVNGNDSGWTSAQTVGLLSGAIVLLLAFLTIESRVAKPLIPLDVFRIRSIVISNCVGVLWATAVWTWFFIGALLMQAVLGFTPLRVGLTFLPANVIAAIFSLRLSAKVVARIGIRSSIAIGMLLTAIGLALLAHAPTSPSGADLLPAMILVGLGAGIAYNPLVLTALSDVAPNEAGLVSGIFNTTSTLGGALGLGIVASLAAARTRYLLDSGASQVAALTSGYQAAFLLAAVCAVAGACISAVFPLAKGDRVERQLLAKRAVVPEKAGGAQRTGPSINTMQGGNRRMTSALRQGDSDDVGTDSIGSRNHSDW